MIYLHKVIPLLTSPMFAVILLVLWGLYFNSKRACFLAISILVVCSLPVFSNKLISNLEKDYTLAPISSAKQADAVVVLSGIGRTIQGTNGLIYELGEAADRIFAGIDLIKEKKAPVLILTGGKLPWSIGGTEGKYLREICLKHGISIETVRITKNVQNTDQEAKAVAELLRKENSQIILVTSAFHMPRAKRAFEASGVSVAPFPVDFRSPSEKITIIDFIPSAKAFHDNSFFVRELIGRIYYTIKY